MARLRTHPGEVLREEYLVPLGLSARALAKLLDVPPNRLTEIMRGTRDVTADTAIRLGRSFGTDPRFWMTCRPPTISPRRRRRIATRKSCHATRLETFARLADAKPQQQCRFFS
jgi:antitoxin HigA-1